jgi:predicted nucleic acid-binding Zn ribbon protein
MMFKRTATLLLIAVSIAGCATDPRLKSDCDWAQPIRPSRKDVLTRQTKEQIAAHNEAGTRLCNWKANPSPRNTIRIGHHHDVLTA